MKSSLFLLIAACVYVGCTQARDAGTEILNGVWIPVKQELAGVELSPASFENHTLTLQDSVYTYASYNIDRGVAIYADGKMDIYGREGVNAGKHFKAIYLYEDDLLTVCYDLTGESYPEAFDTKDKQYYFLAVFKRTDR